METTYTIIGADGQQYGPISLEQLKGWVAERRVNPETKVLRSDINSWLPAAHYTELEMTPQVQAMAASAPATFAAAPNVAGAPGMAGVAGTPAGAALIRRAHSSARWFYWIAGLSMINTFIAMSKAGLVFVVGLGTTQIIDGVASGMGSGGMAVALVLNTIVAGVFVMFGIFSVKGHAWSFLVGMILYALDGALIMGLSLLAKADLPILALGFHGYVLFLLFIGWKANMELNRMSRGGGR
jgi:hypothetical protein